MEVGDAYVFPGFLTPVLTQLFFPKPPTAFLTYFCRGERWKFDGKRSRLNRGSNTQPPSHESDTLTTEPPWQGNDPKEGGFGKHCWKRRNAGNKHFFLFPVFSALSKRKILIQATSNLLSANLFNLVTSKNVTCGKGLSHTEIVSCNCFQFWLG